MMDEDNACTERQESLEKAFICKFGLNYSCVNLD